MIEPIKVSAPASVVEANRVFDSISFYIPGLPIPKGRPRFMQGHAFKSTCHAAESGRAKIVTNR